MATLPPVGYVTGGGLGTISARMWSSGRLSLSVVTLACLGMLAPRASAGDAEPPAAPPAEPVDPAPAPSLDAVAEAVIAAIKAKDEAAVASAIESGDCWLLADAILARGEPDVAAALAKYVVAASEGSTEFSGLPAYVESRRGKPDVPALRRAACSAEDALARGDNAAALAASQAAAAECDPVTAARLWSARGKALLTLEQYPQAAKALVTAADAARSAGWSFRALDLYQLAGNVAVDGLDFPTALLAWRRRAEVAGAVGMPDQETEALDDLARLHLRMGSYAESLRCAEKALAAYDAGGKRGPAARMHECMGRIQFALGNDAQGLELLTRALKAQDELGLKGDAAATLFVLGNLHAQLGRFDEAEAFYTRSLETRESLENERAAATTLGSLGNLHANRGDYAKALEALERSLAIQERLGDRANIAVMHGNIGLVHARLGDFERALADHEKARALKLEIGDRPGLALTLDNIGNTHYFLRDFEKALEFHEQALAMEVELGDKVGTAWTLGNIGLVHAAQGQTQIEEGLEEEGRASLAKAVETHARALKLSEELTDRIGIARGLEKIGRAYAALGDSPKALAALDRAVAAAEALRSNRALFDALDASAAERLRSGDAKTASDQAHRAVEILPTLVSGLGDEQGAKAREAKAAALFSVGTIASARTGDETKTAYFVESGRAGTLLEALGGGDALRSAVLPAELAAAEKKARAEVLRAQEAYGRSVSTGDRVELRRLGEALDKAQKALSGIVERIQRQAKRAASVLYGKPDSLAVIVSRLGKDEALVEYALCDPDAIALVVTPAGGRIVSLGKSADVVAACGAFRCDDPSEDVGAGILALRRMLVEPLGLGAEVRRVLVSPEGALGYVPFSALALGVEIVCVPSATTYGVLREERAPPGKGYLALGDPFYGDPEGPGEPQSRAGPRLARLEGTREEALAIGDVSLLGKEATEAGFLAALRKGTRWRAIHFACHGLVDTEKPMLSSLALTPAGEDDGFLRAQEILKNKIPTDLVVLSACETSKGEIVQGEGILGLTRAFMLAGSPRVICSLWKVDDDATRVLMKKFYEHWKTGTPTAKALRDAQSFVRAQPQWKHPSYWGAWVLWGLSD